MIRPIDALSETKSYAIPPRPTHIDLPLGNTERLFMSADEQNALDASWRDSARDASGHYPDARPLEAALGRLHGIESSRVIVTAGADEALERACKCVLQSGRNLVLPVPTFAMIPHYAKLTGAEVRPVEGTSDGIDWDAVESSCDANTAALAVISPNNPTGRVIDLDRFLAFAQTHQDILCIFDGAYAEFADEDPLTALTKLSNVVVVRTMSKAWGLPGLRVGYAVASPSVITWMRATSGPYTISHPSLRLAEACLETGHDRKTEFVSLIKEQRTILKSSLEEQKFRVEPSQANFLLAEAPRGRADYWEACLASLGIGVRRFGGTLSGSIRMSCPGTEDGLERVCQALTTIGRPDALIFDMDGVMVDVSESYRAAIVATAARFGVEVTRDMIADRKAQGNANNDWVVTRDLITAAGITVSLEEVTTTFEDLYQGDADVPGLREKERLTAPRSFYESLKERFKLGIVTGRPRSDAMFLLEKHNLTDLFSSVVCMEDAALKPSPEPVLRACGELNTSHAWMFGDTPDDIRAARAARVLPIGVAAPGELPEHAQQTLMAVGAARVVDSIIDWET